MQYFELTVTSYLSFCITLYILVYCDFQVPYTVIDQNTRNKLPPTVVQWYSSVRQFEPTSSYGLFRR